MSLLGISHYYVGPKNDRKVVSDRLYTCMISIREIELCKLYDSAIHNYMHDCTSGHRGEYKSDSLSTASRWDKRCFNIEGNCDLVYFHD